MSAAGERTLSQILRAAIDGRPPPAVGQVEVVPPPPGPSDAVVAFTAHHVVAAPVDERAVMAQLPPARARRRRLSDRRARPRLSSGRRPRVRICQLEA